MNFDYLQSTLPAPLFALTCLSYFSLTIYLSYFIANEYFITSLLQILNRLKLGSNVAGIILLNMFNGIPDLITYLVLSNDTRNTDGIVIISLGSFLFMLTVALGLVILFSKKRTHLDFTAFYNNLVFISTTFCFFIYLLVVESVHFYVGVAMVVFYLFFLLFSFYFSNLYEDNTEQPLVERQATKSFIQRMLSKINLVSRIFIDMFLLSYKESTRLLPKNVYGLTSPVLTFSVLYFYLAPSFDIKAFSVACLILLLIGSFFSYCIKNDVFNLPLFIYTLSASCFLIYILTNESLSFFNYLSTKDFIPIDFSYAIFIPIGNCLGDLVTGVASSRKGLFKTAANACMTSSIYNTFFSLGITFMYITSKNGFKPVKIAFESTLTYVLIAFVPLVIINMIVNYEIRNRKLASEFAGVMLFCYALFAYFCVLQYKHDPFNK